MYNTNCADGGNYGKNSDSYRTAEENHFRYNYHATSNWLYEKVGDNVVGRAMMKANNIKNPEADLQRANYHMNEFNKKNESNMGYYEAAVKGALKTVKRSLSPKKK